MLKIIIAISLFMPWFSIGSMDMKYLEEQIDKFLMELENNPNFNTNEISIIEKYSELNLIENYSEKIWKIWGEKIKDEEFQNNIKDEKNEIQIQEEKTEDEQTQIQKEKIENTRTQIEGDIKNNKEEKDGGTKDDYFYFSEYVQARASGTTVAHKTGSSRLFGCCKGEGKNETIKFTTK